jgi:TolB-like protein/class 3 adenylate cyclase/Flp pilus assembly protein TadD
MSETGKLAAILVADVVGYSRLAGADEERTLARLRGLHSDLIDPAMVAHRGLIVKRTGDGIIAEFRSVVDAVRCAIEVQSGLIERNAGVAEDRRIEFRVGIHVGDVVEESDGDLMGDGVNIAARLEGIAKPGAICLSEQAYWQVKSRLDLKVSDLGPVQLKNIAELVHVYSLEVTESKPPPSVVAAVKPESRPTVASRWSWRWLALAALLILAVAGWTLLAGRLTKPAQAAHLSVVVLPFTNLSGDPSQDYFVDSVTDNLTTDLSRIKGSFVIARNTAFTYKGRSIDAKEIGKELGVRYVLEGSVQRDQNRVRVNAQLIDAETGAHMWADRFEEDITDLFKLQDQIVAQLANNLDWALTKAKVEKDVRSANPDALDLSMRGWYLVNSSFSRPPDEARDMLHQALAFFEQAVQIDPTDVDAFNGTAVAYLLEFVNGWGDPGTDYDVKILGQANRAINLAPDYADLYWVKALYLAVTRRAKEALGAAEAGLALNPNIPALYQARGLAEVSLGSYEQAKADFEQAIRLSPRDPGLGFWHENLGDVEVNLGRFDAAIDEYRKALDMGLQVYFVHTNLAAAYALAGKKDEAKIELAEARRLNPAITVKWVKEHAPNLPAVFDGLRKAGLPEQ